MTQETSRDESRSALLPQGAEFLSGGGEMGALMREFGGSFARAGAVVTLIYALGLALVWLSPETKGRPLPE